MISCMTAFGYRAVEFRRARLACGAPARICGVLFALAPIAVAGEDARALDVEADHDRGGVQLRRARDSGAGAGQRHRGVSVQPIGGAAPPSADEDDAPGQSSGGLTITPLPPKSMSIEPGRIPVPANGQPTIVPPRPKEPIRIALRGPVSERSIGSGAQAPYVVVAPNEHPDIVWDAATRDVSAGADVLSHNVDMKELPAVIDRAATVRWLETLAGKGPQPIRVFPNDRRLHRKGEHMEITIGGVSDRNLVLFSLAGDGTLQFLYPLGSDSALIQKTEYRIGLIAREPLGADQIVAISSKLRMPQLEQSLRQFDRLRDPMKVIDLLSRHIRGDALVGTVGIFTAR